LMLLFGGVVVAGLWMRRQDALRNRPEPDADPLHQVLVVSTGSLLVILIPRLAWLHYYVLAIPAFLVGLSAAPDLPFTANPGLRSSLILLAFWCLATNPWLNLGISLAVSTHGVMAVCALLILVALTAFPRSLRARQACG
jgi:hypothetical protein